MFEAEILVPLANNDGKPFTEGTFEGFELKLSELFGGATRLEGPTTGVWLDGNRLYADRLVRYVVALRSIGDGAKVVAAAEVAKVTFEQLAVYVRYLGQSEIL